MISKPEIDNALAEFLDGQIASAASVGQQYKDVLKVIKDLALRDGKRLRPALTVLAYEGFGGTDRQDIMPAALSQELFHLFLLIHDDVIDRDQVRHGGPNVSGHFQKIFNKNLSSADARHFADSWALLAGDACAAMANQLLLSSPGPASTVNRAARLLQDTLFQVVGGEILDTAGAIFQKPHLKPQQILNTAYYKTATYSFQTPLQIGALLAGAKQDHLEDLKNFGGHLGIAYQLQDDLISMFSSPKEHGKSAVSDLREGKQTLLMYYGLKLASPKDKLLLNNSLGNPSLAAAQAQQISEILIKNGAKMTTANVVQKETAKAQAYLDKSALTAGIKEKIRGLVPLPGWQ